MNRPPRPVPRASCASGRRARGGRLWPRRGPDQRVGDDRSDGLTPDAGGLRRRDRLSGVSAGGPDRRHLPGAVRRLRSRHPAPRELVPEPGPDDDDTTTPFSDSDAVQIVQKATAARGGTPPKILMSSWTPPAYLKSNGVTRPPCGSRHQTFRRARSSRAAAPTRTRNTRTGGCVRCRLTRQQGVVPDCVSIQNEPDYLHPVLGDLPVRRQRRRIDEGHRRRRVRASAGCGLPRAIQASDLATRRCCSVPRPPASSAASCSSTWTASTSSSWAASRTTCTAAPRTIRRPTGSTGRCATSARPPPGSDCRPS